MVLDVGHCDLRHWHSLPPLPHLPPSQRPADRDPSLLGLTSHDLLRHPGRLSHDPVPLGGHGHHGPGEGEEKELGALHHCQASQVPHHSNSPLGGSLQQLMSDRAGEVKMYRILLQRVSLMLHYRHTKVLS